MSQSINTKIPIYDMRTYFISAVHYKMISKMAIAAIIPVAVEHSLTPLPLHRSVSHKHDTPFIPLYSASSWHPTFVLALTQYLKTSGSKINHYENNFPYL